MKTPNVDIKELEEQKEQISRIEWNLLKDMQNG